MEVSKCVLIGVVAFLCLLLSVAYLADLVSQIAASHSYHVPDSLIELYKSLILWLSGVGGATGTVVGLVAVRAHKARKKEKEGLNDTPV